MTRQSGLWGIVNDLKQLSAKGDTLEKFSVRVDFEIFRPVLSPALCRSDPSKGGRPTLILF